MEEWNHAVKEVAAAAYYVHQRAVCRSARIVFTNAAASQRLLEQLEDVGPFRVLTHPKFRYQLEPMPQIGSSCDPNREGSFSICEPS